MDKSLTEEDLDKFTKWSQTFAQFKELTERLAHLESELSRLTKALQDRVKELENDSHG